MAKAKRDRLLLKQTYKSGAMLCTDPEVLAPKFCTVRSDFKIIEVELKATGIIERDGKQHEFQELRLILEEKS